jgi:hypothetical protein
MPGGCLLFLLELLYGKMMVSCKLLHALYKLRALLGAHVVQLLDTCCMIRCCCCRPAITHHLPVSDSLAAYSSPSAAAAAAAAGLPFSITCLFLSEPHGVPRQLLPQGLQQLLATAQDEALPEPWPRVRRICSLCNNICCFALPSGPVAPFDR